MPPSILSLTSRGTWRLFHAVLDSYTPLAFFGGVSILCRVGRKQVVNFLAESLNQAVDRSLLREIDAEDQLLQTEA